MNRIREVNLWGERGEKIVSELLIFMIYLLGVLFGTLPSLLQYYNIEKVLKCKEIDTIDNYKDSLLSMFSLFTFWSATFQMFEYVSEKLKYTNRLHLRTLKMNLYFNIKILKIIFFDSLTHPTSLPLFRKNSKNWENVVSDSKISDFFFKFEENYKTFGKAQKILNLKKF